MSAASADESQVTAVSTKPLPERLMQRGSEPIGVIDVRRPQRYYVRITGWFGQRLPLLNQLLARYHDGGNYGDGADSFVYRVAHAFPPETLTASALENSFSPIAGVARPIPVMSVAVTGNDRASPTDTGFSAAAVTNSFSPTAGVTQSIPILSVTAVGNNRPSPADTVLSATAITGPSATPSELALSTFTQEEPGLRFASRGAINRAPTPAPSRLRHDATDGPDKAHGSITRPLAAVSTRALPERLAQRGSKPLGVIDVQQPQQHYTRTAGQLGQHLPLLNRLLTRYHDGGEHGVGAGGSIYRARPSFPPAMVNAFISAASSNLPGGTTATAAQPADLTQPGHVSRGTGGIARRTSAVIATAAETRLPGGMTATVAQSVDLAPAAAAPVESAAAPPAMTMRVRRQAPLLADTVSTLAGKTLAETTVDGRTDPAAGIPNQPATPSPLPSGEALENRPAAAGARSAATLPLATGLQVPLPVRSRSMARSPAGTGPIAVARRLQELQPTATAPEPVITRKAIDTVSSAGGAKVDATATADALAPPHAEPPDSMPLARRTVALHLSESITETADQPALPLSESITRAADQPVLPLILEKPAAAAPVPSLVWRKSFATSTSTTGAGNPEMTDVTRAVAVAAYPVAGGMLSTAPPIMRAESTNLSADDQPGASAPTSRTFQATALDWDSLLAQVSRRLLRQLAIERERRGGKKWS